jgi:pilus assembly protein Flp/PilA
MLLSLYAKGKTFAWGMRDRISREDGAVATEYGLLLVLIALAIVVAATALGVAIANVFNKGTTELGKTP